MITIPQQLKILCKCFSPPMWTSFVQENFFFFQQNIRPQFSSCLQIFVFNINLNANNAKKNPRIFHVMRFQSPVCCLLERTIFLWSLLRYFMPAWFLILLGRITTHDRQMDLWMCWDQYVLLIPQVLFSELTLLCFSLSSLHRPC